MDEILGFGELKIGQGVKARGKWSEGNHFGAIEISVKPPAVDASIETTIQEVDHQNKTLGIFDRKVALPKEIKVNGPQDPPYALEDLRPGVTVKLKGKYSAEEGFLPDKIKVREARNFNIDLLKGNIDDIDRESKILNVAGFNIKISPKTIISGL